MRHHHSAVVSACLAATAALQLRGQQPTHVIRGSVATANGMPVSGANVFLLETLDAAVTDDSGRFVLRISALGRVTVVVRHIGFAPLAIEAPVDTSAALTFALVAQAAKLAPITVQAGAYTAGDRHGMTLTSLEVVTTPGATADIARAIQTLPGVQNVDEGTGLFVRGGDVNETKVLLNDVVMLSPYNYETPTGNYTVTVNPFLLDGIFFSSGGFGARYGNVLSGVADLSTAGRPLQSSITAVAGLASVSTGADLALADGLAVHATAARNDTDLLFKLNGSTRAYEPPPNGEDFSASVIDDYRPTGEIKTFAIDRRSALGIGVNDPSFDGGYSDATHSTMVQASWKDLFGAFAPSMSVAYQSSHRDDGFGVFDLDDTERWSQLFAQTAWSASDRVTLRVGGDVDWRTARFVGTKPFSQANEAPGARFTVIDASPAGSRDGAFGETDWRALENLRVIAGLRTDYSSFSRVRTVDPRLSLAYKLAGATITAAAGGYHEVLDPLYYAYGLGKPGIGPERGRQFVVGMQAGEDRAIARVELYDKQYADLSSFTADNRTLVDGGTGDAHGADVFLKRQLWPFFSTRVTYSWVTSTRTDPATGKMARAPFDITNSITLIGDQDLPKGWSVSGAFRYATGKPYTPVVGAMLDSSQGAWQPIYGAANSLRLPAAQRVDLSISRVTHPGASTVLVYFAEVENLFDRDNLYEYTYNADYTRRIPVRSLFNRSLYVGASLTHTRN